MENVNYEGHPALVRAWIADTSSPAWSQPHMLQNFISYGANRFFEAWQDSLYRMPPEEFCASQWEKIGSHGVRTLIQSHPDGTLTELNQTPPWEGVSRGEWAIYGNHAIIRVYDWDLLVFFQGSGKGCGPEHKGGDPLPHAHFTLTRIVPPPTPSPSLTEQIRERVARVWKP